ncbi:MAG: hydrogenase maturation protease [Anaerolineaceae bacterium]|nr:hydrogenase maturation protease [Anaerolineaceae bacterium]
MFKKYSTAVPMPVTLTQNNSKLLNETTILGIGHPLLSDDAVGIFAMRYLQDQVNSAHSKRFQFIETQSAPENFLGPICQFAPRQILLFDAIHAESDPGTIFYHQFELTDSIDSQPFSLPLNNICFFLKKELECVITIIGIQVKNIHFGETITPEVQTGIKKFINQFAAHNLLN